MVEFRRHAHWHSYIVLHLQSARFKAKIKRRRPLPLLPTRCLPASRTIDAAER